MPALLGGRDMGAVVRYPSAIHLVSASRALYPPSVKENPYEVDGGDVALLMELNIHLKGV